MSRVEDILKGTYTGNPLSRIEKILIDTPIGGGGSVDLSGVNNRITIAEEGIAELNMDVSNLKKHGVQDMNAG